MGVEVGPAAFATDINVDTGERLNLTLEIENTGNAVLDLAVRVNPELTTWTIQVTHGLQTESREVDVAIQPGQSAVVNFEILVSPVAVRNDENHLVIKTSQDQSNFIINETTLIVKDEIGLSITQDANFSMSTFVNDDFTFNTLTVQNTGNSGISVEWSNSLPPDGWSVGFANVSAYLEPRQSVEILVGIRAPINQDANSNAFTLGVYATISNGFETMQVAESYPVEVLSGGFCALDYDSESRTLLGIERGESSVQTLTITNIGNAPLDANLSVQLEADEWDYELSDESVTSLGVGTQKEIEIEVSTNEDTAAGIEELTFNCGSSMVTFEMSVKNTKTQGGLFGLVSPVVAYSIISALVLVVAIVARRIKKSAPKDLSGEELVSPDAHSIPDDGMRMQAVMDSVVGQESLASGGVTAEEIADALAKSIPSLPPPSAPVIPSGRPPSSLPAGRPPVVVPMGRPPVATPAPVPVPQVQVGPPLPPTGLPPGWSMEQWQHYGHQWLAQQGQQ
jgi:uncharacterized membrane protein